MRGPLESASERWAAVMGRDLTHFRTARMSKNGVRNKANSGDCGGLRLESPIPFSKNEPISDCLDVKERYARRSQFRLETSALLLAGRGRTDCRTSTDTRIQQGVCRVYRKCFVFCANSVVNRNVPGLRSEGGGRSARLESDDNEQVLAPHELAPAGDQDGRMILRRRLGTVSGLEDDTTGG